MQPYLQASGGCGTYHYIWSPSVGLSSDTVPNPLIIVDDSINYNVTVTDGNGNVATTQFFSIPIVHVSISLDTAVCSGCPASIHASYSPDYIYQWYLNDSLLQNADSSSLTPLVSGNYHVVVKKQNFACTAVSDTIYYLVTQTPEDINDEIMSLKPNTSNGLSQLKVGLSRNQHMSVNLSSITDRNNIILFEGNSKDISLWIDSQKYSPGIYIISITTEKSRRQLRWVVTR